MNNLKVSVSPGNTKMGVVPSVSLPACTTCNPAAPCFKKCYAARLSKLRPTVRNAYQRNFDILSSDPSAYWLQVRAAACMTRFFRYHVSGDIPSAEYFAEMVKTAEMLPNTEFLCFTKQYHFVNEWLTENGGELPKNLHVLFSLWNKEWNKTIDNPFNLPTAGVIFKGENPDKFPLVCPGNCENCACRGMGCWSLKKGESIAFCEH